MGPNRSWALALGLSLLAALSAGCSSRREGAPTAAAIDPAEATGSADLALRLGRTTQINTASYALTGPNGYSASGSIDIRQDREIETTIPGIPAGGPYTIALTAASTDKNTTCTGTRSNITVSCPGTRERDENVVRLTCTRNHVGREWGDRGWASNAKTFFLYAEIDLACAPPDACARISPSQACGANDCGTASDGCGGTYRCGICTGTNAACSTDGGTPGVCRCSPVPATEACGGHGCGTAPDGCGGTYTCGTCSGANVACSTDGGTPGACVCTPSTAAQACAGNTCGTAPDGCGGTVNCGTCMAHNVCGSDGGAGVCVCAPATPAQACGSMVCGTVPDGCGGTISCGTCSGTTACGATGQCVDQCPTACPSGENCGTYAATVNGVACPPVGCGTCQSPNTCSGGADGGGGTCQCIPQTAAQACPKGPFFPQQPSCGIVPDGCGGTLSCGTCVGTPCVFTTGGPPGAQAGFCECPPLPKSFECVTGGGMPATCGHASDGCGYGGYDCGTCDPGVSCSGANGGPGICGCVPVSAAAACGDNDCGSAPDGCGGLVNCGTCGGVPRCSNRTGGAGTCSCTPLTQAAACGPNNCGFEPDGCGGTVSCGVCTLPFTCSAIGGAAGTCGCQPLTHAQVCGSTFNCGTAPDGCGGTIQCGSCAPTGACSNASGGPGICNCPVVSNGCAGHGCGTSTDNCGNPVVCGTCPAGQTCNAAGQCGEALGCVPGVGNTTACLSLQGANCLSCVQSNGCLDPSQEGGGCEDVTGTAPHFTGTLGDGATCTSVFAVPAPNETEVCLQTLGQIFTSKCAATLQEGPCLCGMTDAALCFAGSATPTGPLYDLYQCDFDTTAVQVIQSSQFTNQATGAGQANAVVQCAAAFGCGCF